MTASQRLVIFLGFLIVFLFGLFFLLKPKSVAAPIVPADNSYKSASDSARSAEQHIDLVIQNNKLISPAIPIELNQNDHVTLSVTSDEDEEFHIHGYDRKLELTANQPANLSITFNLSGRFPFELEHSGTELGTFEVQPK